MFRITKFVIPAQHRRYFSKHFQHVSLKRFVYFKYFLLLFQILQIFLTFTSNTSNISYFYFKYFKYFLLLLQILQIFLTFISNTSNISYFYFKYFKYFLLLLQILQIFLTFTSNNSNISLHTLSISSSYLTSSHSSHLFKAICVLQIFLQWLWHESLLLGWLVDVDDVVVVVAVGQSWPTKPEVFGLI
jgi:hypothetical protein